jgi:hypothetical protein
MAKDEVVRGIPGSEEKTFPREPHSPLSKGCEGRAIKLNLALPAGFRLTTDLYAVLDGGDGVPDAGDSSFEVDVGPMQPQCLTAPAAGQSQEGVERAVTVFATRFEERSEFATRPRIGSRR